MVTHFLLSHLALLPISVVPAAEADHSGRDEEKLIVLFRAAVHVARIMYVGIGTCCIKLVFVKPIGKSKPTPYVEHRVY